jgi:hypothetical protein
MMAAPASAAAMEASAISSAVTDSAGDMDGVWMAPVTAQVMMTFRAMCGVFPRSAAGFRSRDTARAGLSR